ncbi:MAG: bifunctional hydroxymethylpyrimidine kinase/phosphomethylpyrimidine kinase [Rhodospirillales bacterium]|nr:bifunctional hydroxymethylpyrimidine kinase/phosphomethylpyrimidine kinase [Rhodospirillales bacterium]
MSGRVLAIAGSDSGGGAGIQADIKTITALGGFAMTAITAITVQDTLAVHEVQAISPRLVARQMAVVLDDLGADAIKTGMLGDVATIEAVCAAIETHGRGLPLVVDPVMRATSGQTLLTDAALAHLKRRLLPLASLVTPNIPEAEVLAGMTISDRRAMHHAAEVLLTLGVPAVLLKGGHLPGEDVIDLLATDSGIQSFHHPRLMTRHTHGTGCTLASAVATGLAQGMALAEAVSRAGEFVHAAIAAAPGYGRGHGPLGHAMALRSGVPI